jgi:hypothetical protein
MNQEINKISNGNTKKEKEITKAINRFYDYMPTAERNIKIS